MSQPKQHHYLAQKGHLKFFESAEKADFLWRYERNKEPILISTYNAAKEHHLYSSINEDGTKNTDLESGLSELDGIAKKHFEAINNAEGPIIITAEEKADIAFIIAMQYARTPAFRGILKKQTGEWHKIYMQANASNEKAFEASFKRAMKQAKKERPEMPEMDMEEFRKTILGGKYELQMDGNNYFLKQAFELGVHVFPAIMMKEIGILKSKSIELITSDHPVNLIPQPGIPPIYSGGFLMSGILTPIGTHTALFCRNPKQPTQPPEPGEKVGLGYKEMSPELAATTNQIVIDHAETYLFGSSKDETVRKLFDKTEIPKRFYIDSPYSQNDE